MFTYLRLIYCIILLSLSIDEPILYKDPKKSFTWHIKEKLRIILLSRVIYLVKNYKIFLILMGNNRINYCGYKI